MDWACIAASGARLTDYQWTLLWQDTKTDQIFSFTVTNLNPLECIVLNKDSTEGKAKKLMNVSTGKNIPGKVTQVLIMLLFLF